MEHAKTEVSMVCFPPHRYFSIVWAWVVDITIKFMDFRKSFSCVKHNCLVRGSPCTPLLSLKNYCLIKVNDHTLFYSFSKKGWYLKKVIIKVKNSKEEGMLKKKAEKGDFWLSCVSVEKLFGKYEILRIFQPDIL